VFNLAILGLFVGVIVSIILILMEYPLLILIPALLSVIKLSIAVALHIRDKKKAAHLPSLPCEGHKGTWSNPKYFSEEELESKE